MRVVDLFAGCGGLSLGFEEAGFEVCAAFEYWAAAAAVYQLNFNHPVLSLDLSSPEAAETVAAFQSDIVVGGPPCQDFSSAGKRNEDGGRGDLSLAFANIVAQTAPRYFVMENVERIIKTQKLVEVQKILTAARYQFYPVVLDASLCGVPQKRKRFFLFGAKNLESARLQAIIQRRLAPKPLTVREYMGSELDVEYYYRHPRTYNRRGVFSIDEPSPTIRGVNRPVPGGYTGHCGDAAPVSDGLRPLTFEERCRIQTFPPRFQFAGSKSDREQMLGNAVPVNLARFVAEVLKEYIQTETAAAPRLPEAVESLVLAQAA